MLLSTSAVFLKVLAQSRATLVVVGCWLLIVDCCGKLVDCRMEEDHRSVQRQSFPRKSDHLIFRGYWNKKYIAAEMNVLHLQLGAINSICFICKQTPPKKCVILLYVDTFWSGEKGPTLPELFLRCDISYPCLPNFVSLFSGEVFLVGFPDSLGSGNLTKVLPNLHMSQSKIIP